MILFERPLLFVVFLFTKQRNEKCLEDARGGLITYRLQQGSTIGGQVQKLKNTSYQPNYHTWDHVYVRAFSLKFIY